MYTYAAWLLAAAVAIGPAGCGGVNVNGGAGMSAGTAAAPATPPGMEGYVVAKENGRILVVDPVPLNFSETGGISEYYNAIWFSDAPEHAEVGHRVNVWFDAVAESYPGQSRATRTEVLTSPKPERADLSEAEAIRKALEEHPTPWPAAIRHAEYDADADVWHVQIRFHEGDAIDAQVEDR